jgi:hypothetical protein
VIAWKERERERRSLEFSLLVAFGVRAMEMARQ